MTVLVKIEAGYRYTIPIKILSQVIYYLKLEVIHSWKIHLMRLSLFDETIENAH